MTTISFNAVEVNALRSQMKLCDEDLSFEDARSILLRTGDSDLAMTALLLKPRPDWLRDLIGA